METKLSIHSLCQSGQAVIKTETAAIAALQARIDERFAQACQIMLACQGRIIVLGMGKSGHIGNKIAATLASTGTPAFFVHPAEASHGDLGMITRQDVALALSNSGETSEILLLLPLLKRLGIPLISLTGNPLSNLAKAATVNLDVSVAQEACPLGLAPTASTAASLAMGDALAIALLEARGFTADDFALAHPGGSLGRRLLLHCEDVMHRNQAIPKVSAEVTISDALLEMTRKGLGMTIVVDDQQQLLGIFTDGDLRRVLDKAIDIHQTPITQVMTHGCKTVSPTTLAAEALQLMETFQITSIVVLGTANMPCGVVHIHDLLKAGVV